MVFTAYKHVVLILQRHRRHHKSESHCCLNDFSHRANLKIDKLVFAFHDIVHWIQSCAIKSMTSGKSMVFSWVLPVSFTNEVDHQDKTEILFIYEICFIYILPVLQENKRMSFFNLRLLITLCRPSICYLTNWFVPNSEKIDFFLLERNIYIATIIQQIFYCWDLSIHICEIMHINNDILSTVIYVSCI